MLLGKNILCGVKQVGEGGAHQVFLGLNVVDLPDVAQEGDAEHRPPQAGQQNHQLKGQHIVHAHHQQNDDGKDEGDGAAANVAHSVAPGGDPVHALVGGHIGEEGVVKQAGAGKADMGEHIAHQQHAVLIKKSAGEGKQHPNGQKTGKKPHFVPLVVRQSP